MSSGLLAVTDAEGTQRIGLLPSVWWLALSIAGFVAVATATRLSARASLPLFLSLGAVLPWIPLPVPAVFLAWTGPAAGLVWAAIALSLLAEWAARQRLAGPRLVGRGLAWLGDPRVAPPLAAVLAFAAFLAVRSGQHMPPTGDEPHYLILAQSLLYDHDIKVANNYERRDYLAYYGGPLAPHFSRPGVEGQLYSLHAPGLPLLIAPALAAGGYRGVVLWIAALTAIGSALVWSAGHRLTGEPAAAWFGWAAVTLTVPGVLHASLVYPDAVAGALVAACAFAIVLADRRPFSRALPWSPWASLGLGVAVGLLPWMHTRLALPAAAIGLVLVARVLEGATVRSFAHVFRSRWLHLAALGAPILACGGGWLLFFRTVYGTFSPMAPWAERLPLDFSNTAGGLLGLMADQEFGLIPNAPVHLLSFIGLWFVFKRRRRLGLELLQIVAPYVIATSAWSTWWAGASPPARFLVPIVFPLGIGAASVWAAQGARGRAMSLTLLGTSLLTAAVLAFGGHGTLAYNDSTGRARWLDWVSPLVDLPRAFPSFFRPGAGAGIAPAAMFWATMLLAGAALFVIVDALIGRLGTRAAVTAGAADAATRVRAFLAPACLTLVFALGVTASWHAAGAAPFTVTRGQLGLLRDADPHLRPLGVQPFPARTVPAATVRSRLAISTSRLEATDPGTLLFLTEVPPGRYRVRLVPRRAAPGNGSQPGEVTLGIGRATVPAARWPARADARAGSAFTLPMLASTLSVRADAAAAQWIEKAALVPVRPSIDPPPPAASGWIRDAARYGSSVVYAIDDRVWLEPAGFWVMGERQPDVLIATDEPVSAINLEARNGPLPNRLRVAAEGWSSERRLAPDERWKVRVLVAHPGPAVIINFDVEKGARPVDFDPTSTDHRWLGCWIEVY